MRPSRTLIGIAALAAGAALTGPALVGNPAAAAGSPIGSASDPVRLAIQILPTGTVGGPKEPLAEPRVAGGATITARYLCSGLVSDVKVSASLRQGGSSASAASGNAGVDSGFVCDNTWRELPLTFTSTTARSFAEGRASARAVIGGVNNVNNRTQSKSASRTVFLTQPDVEG